MDNNFYKFARICLLLNCIICIFLCFCSCSALAVTAGKARSSISQVTTTTTVVDSVTTNVLPLKTK